MLTLRFESTTFFQKMLTLGFEPTTFSKKCSHLDLNPQLSSKKCSHYDLNPQLFPENAHIRILYFKESKPPFLTKIGLLTQCAL